MDDRELTRYSRQLMLPDFGLAGQRALKAATVVVVGMGGLGCPVATYLSAAGVGRLHLIDHDRVDLTNLHRQVLYTPVDVGRPKVEAAVERLAAANPEVELLAHAQRADQNSAWFEQLLETTDVIVDGTDNFSTRYAVNGMAVRRRVPLVYGSVYRFSGEVSTFLHDGAPCYACLHAVPPPAGSAPNCAEGGVLGVLPGMVAMLQATEVLKLLGGLGGLLTGRLLCLDVRRTPCFREWRLERRPDCHVCGTGVAPPWPQSAPPESEAVPEVTLEAFRQHLAGAGYLLVDIRSPAEHAFGRLRGSLALHGGELETFVEQGPRPVVLACKSGGRSRVLAAKLRRLGWTEASSLAGDWASWAASGEPLVAY